MKLSDKIIKLRKANSWSQEDLAEKLNVSRQAISRWEMGTSTPDAANLLHISKLFGVSTDYLLNDTYESDNDLPKVKESNKILQANLTLIAIICQASFLNAAMRPFQGVEAPYMLEMLIKVIPLITSSIWMAYNLRYEKDAVQYRKNVKIELGYCLVQAGITLFGYYSQWYWMGTLLLIAVTFTYIFWVNPKYMNRRMTKMKGK